MIIANKDGDIMSSQTKKSRKMFILPSELMFLVPFSFLPPNYHALPKNEHNIGDYINSASKIYRKKNQVLTSRRISPLPIT